MSGALARVRTETAEGDIREAVDQAVRAVARAVIEETEGVRALPAALTRIIRDGASAYTVRGSLFRDDGGRVPAVVVLVERQEIGPPSSESIRAFLGLTRRQAMVARLIASGQTNAQIAADLSISEHTARHHTESIMGKLGCRTRAEVAEAVMAIAG